MNAILGRSLSGNGDTRVDRICRSYLQLSQRLGCLLRDIRHYKERREWPTR